MFKKVFTDIYLALMMWQAWTILGMQEIRSLYKRSFLGPWWITISLGISIGAMGLLYAKLFHMTLTEYLPYLTNGLISWTLISALIIQSSTIFVVNEGVIRQTNLPFSFYIFRMICKSIITWAHHLIILVFVLICFGKIPDLNILWIFISMFLIIIAAFSWSLIFGTLCLYFRDLQQIIVSLVQLVFFVTPIFWMPKLLGGTQWILKYNLFYYYIKLSTYPFIHKSILDDGLLFQTSLITLFTLVIALFIFAKCRSRISYWV